MEWIANLFGSVPHLVWGSLITFAGVVYADTRNSRRAERQNRFAAEQGDKERLMTLRKEVYLEAPAAFLRMQTELFSLVNFHDAKVNSIDAPDVTDVMAKVTLVSSSETAVLAERLAVDYGVTHSRLLVDAQLAREANEEVKRHAKSKERAIEEYERLVAECKRELESGQASETRLSALRVSLKHAEGLMIEKEKLEIASANKEAIASHIFLGKARDACLPLVELTIKITVALRWELGQPTDHEQYEQEMRRAREAFLRVTDESLAGLKVDLKSAQD